MRSRKRPLPVLCDDLPERSSVRPCGIQDGHIGVSWFLHKKMVNESFSVLSSLNNGTYSSMSISKTAKPTVLGSMQPREP